MATVSSIHEANGEGASTNGQSAAQRLQALHEAQEAHRVSVEDVVDEEDILHPPPSSGKNQPASSSPAADIPMLAKMSEKAAGKQRAQEPSTKSSVLDTQSEENFPALGGSKPRAPPTWGAQAPAWGQRRNDTAPAVNGRVNGTATMQPLPGAGPVHSSAASSGAATPASSIAQSTSQSQGPRAGPQVMSIPGRFTDSIQLAPSQMAKNKVAKPILDDINRKSKARVSQRIGPNQNIIFEGSGPQEAVRQALKQISRQLGVQQTVKIPVPTSVRPHIIGKGGANIQNIMQQTGARIQVPKSDESVGGDDEDDSQTIDIEVTGDPLAAGEARRRIEEIASSRTSNVNLRLRDIPPEFYPFIAGPHNRNLRALERDNLRIDVPQYHTWQQRPPPQMPRSNERPAFTSHPDLHIRMVGDRSAAQEARLEIERQAEQLRQQLSLEEQNIHRAQHQFIIGDKGMSLHDFLDQTGCAIVLPPDSDNTENITIIGPADQLEAGINKAQELAAEMQMSSIDLGRYHSNASTGADAHARALTRYLMDRELAAELQQMHNAHIVVPNTFDGPMDWQIFAREGKNALQARNDIVKIIQAHPPSRITQVPADPFFHRHVQSQFEESMLNQLGVRMILPMDDDANHIVLVYEGTPEAATAYQIPRQRPTNPEMQTFEEALQQAQNQISSFIMADQQDLLRKELEVPPKFHDKVRKHVKQQSQPTPPHGFPVNVAYGSDKQAKGSGKLRPDGVSLHGPTAHVGALEAQILEFLKEVEKEELERGYTTTCPFPQKYANQLIGKRGENINRLREEFDVDINVDKEGQVTIKGPQAKAEKCKAHIINYGKKLEDEAFYAIKIDPKYHRDLIGPKGASVRKLEERYGVHIQFPSSKSFNDDQSVADTASEIGGPRRGRNQPVDEISIRGPRKSADEARSEILELVQYYKDRSHEATISVAKKQIPSLMGKGGNEMESVRGETGAQIDVPSSSDSADPNGRVQIKIRGTKVQVDKARALLQDRVKTFDETAVKTIDVDKKYHQALIGAGGQNIRRIVLEAGGPENSAKVVRFPDRNSDSSTIRIEGPATLVNKVHSSIESFVTQKENQSSDMIDVPVDKHRMLIGRGGETRRNIENQFKVTVDIPRQDSGRTGVKISGGSEEISKAKAHIAELVKDQAGETVQIPRSLHHTLGQNGAFFRKLRNDHGVTIDHAGHKLPPRSEGAGSSRRKAAPSGSTPLITDDPSAAANAYSWDVVDRAPAVNGSSDASIPWVISGPSPEAVSKARTAIERSLAEASQPLSTGFLILPDSRSYRLVIGPGGREINRIREKTGCRIQVPKAQGQGSDREEAIEIVGSRDGIEEARDMILETIRKD